jgi:large subunit ribosomal protein L23
MSKTIFLKPRLSEQTYALAQKGRVYVFEVPKTATKITLAKAVSEQFEVTVEAVNITHIKGKAKRTISITGKRRSNHDGSRKDIKKAYVKLAEGFSLPVFAAVEEADEKEQATQKQIDKAAAKQTEKAVKEKKPARRRLGILGKKEDKA